MLFGIWFVIREVGMRWSSAPSRGKLQESIQVQDYPGGCLFNQGQGHREKLYRKKPIDSCGHYFGAPKLTQVVIGRAPPCNHQWGFVWSHFQLSVVIVRCWYKHTCPSGGFGMTLPQRHYRSNNEPQGSLWLDVYGIERRCEIHVVSTLNFLGAYLPCIWKKRAEHFRSQSLDHD